MRPRVVFVGGSILELLVVEKVSPVPRATKDVDIVVEATTTRRYHVFGEELERRGFVVDTEDGAPICRRVLDGRIKVDVMSTEGGALGFSNRWYRAALRDAVEYDLAPGLAIRMPTRPVYLAMKLEAFGDRGAGDYRASHDVEDLITVIDGSPRIVPEIAEAPEEIRNYVAATVRRLPSDGRFVEAIPGHLRGDLASQARFPLVLERLRGIADLP
ncbi:MAG: hypothetical protein HY905_22675 [Deltaproteobacteria bacterium]|nr:hypothetical protein [Deltaproteobacteria bacterium]